MGEPSVQMMTSGETPLGPRLPVRLGRFVLCDELGSGGMATVYLARMQLAAGLERLVALKTIHPHLAKEKAFVDMFLDEARIASLVTHPNVCSTHDFGEWGGVYFLAMEYLLGEPVFDVINALVARFDEVRDVLPYIAARIIADACEGLHAAHVARGPNGEKLHIVHRDVSPQNLFLTYNGSVKVVDFGCAKAAERVAHTSTGVMKGKVGYAAPEQIKGKNADARADVWALGVCLWETLTLSPLFSRSTAVATAMAVLEEPIELASDGRDWVPEEVAQIANHALSRDVDGRFGSARDMGRALRKFIADSGFTLESAELAEWMDFLLEDRHAERLRRSAWVQEMDISHVSDVPLYEVSSSDIEALDSDEAPLQASREPDDSRPPSESIDGSGTMPEAPRPTEEADDELPALPGSSTGRNTMLVLLFLTVTAVGAYLMHYYYEPAEWLLEMFGMEPTATTEIPTAPEPPEEEPDEGPIFRAGAGAEDPAGTERAEEPAPPPEPATTTSSRRRRRRGGGDVVTTIVSGGGTTYLGGGGGTTTTPQVETGLLHITASPGWAEIYEGGRRLGRTPLSHRLPTGTHHLSVRPNGDASRAETVSVHISGVHAEDLSLEIPAP